MRLKLIRVQNYKRFEGMSSLDTRGSVVAIVGPNEAGKTSLLNAITHISSDEAFGRSELTDRNAIPDNQWIVQAHFALEDEDRVALGELLPARVDLTYQYMRYANGQARFSLDPWVPRDKRLRQQAAAKLNAALDEDWFGARTEDDAGGTEQVALADRASDLLAALQMDDDTLPARVRGELADLAEALNARVPEELQGDDDVPLAALAAALSDAAAGENSEAPSSQISEILSARVPECLLFNDEERDLQTEYVWSEHPIAPRALANVFALAGVDYDQFMSVAIADDRAKLGALHEVANENLDRAFEAWRQADIHVELMADQRSLQLLIRDRATKARTRLDDRSAGLRWFVALVAFTARYGGGVRPVLLVDEAETHLHYGAQADLIRVFERLRAAETIIYTTHSIGCLPSDLGATIRVVSPVEGQYHRSVIRNSFWEGDQRAGLTPMMLAMGANALAFTPSRRAVIGEGPSEAILLPSLVRGALPPKERDEPLGYQVAPGVSEVRTDEAEELELEASGVAYLVDADKGGRDHRRKLSQRAHDEGRVVELGDGTEAGLCIEDFVDAEVLAQALNALLTRRNEAGRDRLTAQELPAVARARYIAEWCEQRNVTLRKGWLAQEALDIGRNRGRLVERGRVRQLRELHKKLVRATAATSATKGAE